MFDLVRAVQSVLLVLRELGTLQLSLSLLLVLGFFFIFYDFFCFGRWFFRVFLGLLLYTF